MALTTGDFIDRVKEVIQNQAIPPRYAPVAWQNKKFNCYAYAMRICMHFNNYNNYKIRPGFISRGEKNDFVPTKEFVLNYFMEDCECLGLQVLPTTISDRIRENEYKIAVYVQEGEDFHFARQDSNGNWSEKNGWHKGIELLKQEDVTKNEDGYEFIGIFRVSKK